MVQHLVQGVLRNALRLWHSCNFLKEGERAVRVLRRSSCTGFARSHLEVVDHVLELCREWNCEIDRQLSQISAS